MLVITRREGQSASIGSDIRIQVVRIGQGQVRIGITAPKDVRIERLDRQAGEQVQRADEAKASKENAE